MTTAPGLLVRSAFASLLAVSGLVLLDRDVFGTPHVPETVLGAILLLAMTGIAAMRRTPDWHIRVRPAQVRGDVLVQILCQSSIYLYVAYHANYQQLSSPGRITLIFFQIAFAIAFDFVERLTAGAAYRFKLSVVPLVLSINLFLWFNTELFALQLMTVAVAILVKNRVRRPTGGDEPKHVFNPSGIILSVTAFVLFLNPDWLALVGSKHIQYTYILVPGFDAFLFLVSLVTLWLPNSYLIPFAALAVVLGANLLSESLTGMSVMESPGRGAVLLGMTLLVTDPQTSPRSQLGKLLFGLAYGLLVLLSYSMLTAANLPGYFDKILPVPVLNLFSPRFDDVAASLRGARAGPRRLRRVSATNPAHERALGLCAYAALFLLCYSWMEAGRAAPFLIDGRRLLTEVGASW